MPSRGVRRVALLLGLGCLAVGLASLGYEYATHRVGYFVEMTLPVGTVIDGGHAVLPDSRTVELAGPADAAAPPTAAGPDAAPVRVVELNIRPWLLAIAIGVPLIGLIGLEAIAAAAGWALRGFDKSAAR